MWGHGQPFIVVPKEGRWPSVAPFTMFKASVWFSNYWQCAPVPVHRQHCALLQHTAPCRALAHCCLALWFMPEGPFYTQVPIYRVRWSSLYPQSHAACMSRASGVHCREGSSLAQSADWLMLALMSTPSKGMGLGAQYCCACWCCWFGGRHIGTI